MKAPFSFKTALTVGEKNAYDVLCNVLGLQDGVNAHIGFNPGKLDVFVFAMGGIANGEVMHSGNCEHFNFNGVGEVWHQKRERVQEFIMRMIEFMPAKKGDLLNTNLATLRVSSGGISPIDIVEIVPEGQKDPVPCWHAEFGFDVVFYTGTRK